jgi:Mrp family chromosome partitioning ATPase
MHRSLRKLVRRLDNCDLYLALIQEADGHTNGAPPGPRPVTAVTSTAPREGKTWVTLSLALQASEVAGKRVLVIDADVEGRRSATRLLSSSLPIGEASVDDHGIVTTSFARLSYAAMPLTTAEGPQDQIDRIRCLASAVRSEYDLLLIDGVSLSLGPVAYDLLRAADRSLFVVEHRRLAMAQIASHIERLQQLDHRVIGAVLNKRRYPVPAFLYRHL